MSFNPFECLWSRRRLRLVSKIHVKKSTIATELSFFTGRWCNNPSHNCYLIRQWFSWINLFSRVNRGLIRIVGRGGRIIRWRAPNIGIIRLYRVAPFGVFRLLAVTWPVGLVSNPIVGIDGALRPDRGAIRSNKWGRGKIKSFSLNLRKCSKCCKNSYRK